MRPRLSLFALLGGVACGGDPTIVVAEVEVDEPAPFTCTGGFVPGPSGYEWCAFAEALGSSALRAEPTPDALAFASTTPGDVRAGVAFQFEPDADSKDLSDFSQVEVDFDVSLGQRFELFLGQGPNVGCSYVFDVSSSPYRKDLGVADWCMPSQCGFDLRASGGMVLAHVPRAASLEGVLHGLRFSSNGVAAGRARALGAALGPGDFCWFLVNWTADSVVTGTPPSSSSVEVHGTTEAGGVAGLAFELPSNFGLSSYRTLEVTAIVNEEADILGSDFNIQAVNRSRGLVWKFASLGRPAVTYTVDLHNPLTVFPAGDEPLSLDDVLRFELVISGAIGGRIHAIVTDVKFLR